MLVTFVWLICQVSRLLLLAGANPNELTESLNSAPALCIAAREGHVDLVSLYLEFGADVSACDDSHVPALSYTARRGRVNIIHLLTIQHAKVLFIVCFSLWTNNDNNAVNNNKVMCICNTAS